MEKVRQIYVVGNWKMNQSVGKIPDFFSTLEREISFRGGAGGDRARVGIAPQALHLERCLPLARQLGIVLGAQNCSDAVQGAYTGETSPAALQELGVTFVLLGHSERRTLFGEGDQWLNRKVKTALSQGLAVVFCVGETLEQRESGRALAVLEEQVVRGLEGISKGDVSAHQLLVAYEPVWAIGTGKTATPEVANRAHEGIRETLCKKLGLPGEELSLLYGGSVRSDNGRELLVQEHIDGALVGGASLVASELGELVRIADAVSSGKE